MFNLFSKPDPKGGVEQMRENDRALRKAGRDLERERNELEKEEKKIELEIKRLARQGNKEGCAILARQLVQLRKQKSRTHAASSKVQSVAFQSKNMSANVKLAGAMGATSKALADANRGLRPERIAADARAFAQANMKMEMTDEMISDTLDDMLGASDDEEESDKIIGQVLDEIGIEVSGRMRNAPLPGPGPGLASDDRDRTTDQDIVAQLAKLKS